MTQFYQITLEDAIADYKLGKLTTFGLVDYYIKIKFAPGWKIVLNLRNICSELGLTLNSLYRALKKIKQLGDRHIFIKTEKEYCTFDNNHHTPAKTSCKFAKTDLQTSSKTNVSSDPPDIKLNTKHISLCKQVDKLPQEQRESFLLFANQRVDELPKRPALPSKWIAANFEDLHSEFKRASAPETQKTTQDAVFYEWYGLMRALGHVTDEKKKGDIQLVREIGGEWREYEHLACMWKLDYLRKCAAGK